MSSDAVAMVAALGEDELIDYLEYGGPEKSFKAIVDRSPSQSAVFGGVAYPENSIVITIPRDAVNGVMTVAKGKDRVRLRLHRSDSEKREFTVVMIEEEPAWFAGGIGDLWKLVVK